jgi:6-phosphofructokinase 1
MNAALRIAIRAATNSGHSVVPIYNGLKGLESGKMVKFETPGQVEDAWKFVSGWAPMGGCALGCSRCIPKKKLQIAKLAENIKKFGIDSMIIVGGFEAFVAVQKFKEWRKEYPPLDIPMLLIPATISNNVPGTQVSIGMDCAVNNLVDANDKLRQSVNSCTKRLFIVESLGGRCGYHALMSALVNAADFVYIPEKEIALTTIKEDIDNLIKKFNETKTETCILIKTDKASDIYTESIMRDLFEFETKEKDISVRKSSMGHVIQGGNPTPLDRLHAVRMAQAAVEHFNSKVNNDECKVVGIKKGLIELVDIEELSSEEVADYSNRRPVEQWWFNPKDSSFCLWNIFNDLANSWKIYVENKKRDDSLKSKTE